MKNGNKRTDVFEVKSKKLESKSIKVFAQICSEWWFAALSDVKDLAIEMANKGYNVTVNFEEQHESPNENYIFQDLDGKLIQLFSNNYKKHPDAVQGSILNSKVYAKILAKLK